MLEGNEQDFFDRKTKITRDRNEQFFESIRRFDV